MAAWQAALGPGAQVVATVAKPRSLPPTVSVTRSVRGLRADSCVASTVWVVAPLQLAFARSDARVW